MMNQRPNQQKRAQPVSSASEARARASAALREAAGKDDLSGVRAALSRGADVNARDAKGRTPLLLALSGGEDESARAGDMAQMERAMRASVDRMADARDGRISPVVLTLLKAGAHVNIANADGLTPLMYAIRNGDSALCSELIRRKANVNFRNATGVTPLMAATVLRADKMVDLLLKNGASVKRHGQEGVMPILGMALFPRGGRGGDDGEGGVANSIINALTGAGDDEAGAEAVIERLIRAGADVNEKGKDGVTPLVLAAGVGSPRLVRRFLMHGSRVNEPLVDGSTALLVAASEGRADTARALLEAGADPNVRNRDGDTPLTAASDAACYALVERLLAAGASPDTRTAAGKTARDLAVAKRHTAIVRLLDARLATPKPAAP